MGTNLLTSFWLSFGVSAVLAYPIYRLLLLTKSRQTIDPYAPETHQRKQGTPTMGGLIIAAGFLATIGYSLTKASESERGPLLAALVLFIGFSIVGFVDDFVVPKLMKGKRGLGVAPKLILEVVATVSGAGLMYGFSNLFLVAFFCLTILFFANAFNFADGLDGLAGSLLIGLLVGFLGITSLSSTEWPLVFEGALLGGVIVFLFLNAPPAKVFMGDVGALPIGAVLGLLAMAALVHGNGSAEGPFRFEWSMLLPLFVLSFMMVAELVPVPLQVAYFKVTKKMSKDGTGKRLFPSTPIHHGFEKKGWPETRVVWVFALTQALLSALAYSLVVWSHG